MDDEPLQLSAFLEVSPVFDGFLVSNERAGTSMEVSEVTWRSLELLPERFQATELDCTEEEVMRLRHHFLVVTDGEEEALEEGFLEPAEHPIIRGGSLSELDMDSDSAPVVVLGAPIDVSAKGRAGAEGGPCAIREAFPLGPATDLAGGARLVDVDLRREYQAADIDAVDLGNLPWREGEGTGPFGRRLGWIADRVFSAGGTLLTLGGDHSVSHFILKAALEHYGRVGLVHFDAHDDMAEFHGRVHHANPFTFVLEDPRVAVVRQIGLRRFLTRPASAAAADPRFACWTAREMVSAGVSDVLAGLPDDLPYYVSFDVDCLSPEVAPETGTPEPGGLAFYPTLDLLDALFGGRKVVGVDFVEVIGGGEGFNRAASVVARYAASFLLSQAPHAEMSRHY